MDSESVELYDVENKNLDIETSDDIKALRTPEDWVLESCSVFGSSCRVKWICDDGGYIKVVPYPHPNHYVHSVDLAGDVTDVEGVEQTIRKCTKFMRETTSCDAVKVQGPNDCYITYTKSIYSKNPIESDGKISLDCASCNNSGLVVISQSTNSSVGQELTMEYELICPICESTMRIEETLNSI